MGRYIQSRGREIVAPRPSWRKIFVRKLRILAKSEKRSQERTSAAMNATSASLRENGERKSAVEMTPGGKRGKLKKPKASFPLVPPGLEIRQKAKTPDFHISTAPAAGLSHSPRTKHEDETKFQLTDHGQFRHDLIASVASLRPSPAWRRNE